MIDYYQEMSNFGELKRDATDQQLVALLWVSKCTSEKEHDLTQVLMSTSSPQKPESKLWAVQACTFT